MLVQFPSNVYHFAIIPFANWFPSTYLVYLDGSSRRPLRVHDGTSSTSDGWPLSYRHISISCWLASHLTLPLWFALLYSFPEFFLDDWQSLDLFDLIWQWVPPIYHSQPKTVQSCFSVGKFLFDIPWVCSRPCTGSLVPLLQEDFVSIYFVYVLNNLECLWHVLHESPFCQCLQVYVTDTPNISFSNTPV